MSTETAKAIAAGVGPLIAALIAAYQLWLKPSVDEKREVVRDRARREERVAALRRIRFHLGLFITLVAAVTAIPVGGTVSAAFELDASKPVSIEKVLVVFVALVGSVHLTYLGSRVKSLNGELSTAKKALRKTTEPPVAGGQ